MRALLIPAMVGYLAVGATPAMADESTGPASLAAEWNEMILRFAEAEDGFLTLKGLRTAAMMHLAMHDALNSISKRYTAYVYHEPNPAAEPISAAAEAAFTIAIKQFPDQRVTLQTELDRWLESVRDLPGSAAGRQLGAAAAAAVLEERTGDGWNSQATYKWQPMAPGVYAEFQDHSGTPKGFIFGAGWAEANGFALSDPAQFRASPPPEIDSAAYTKAFNEVKEVGRFQSMARSPDQTHLALWWKDFAENSQNRLARDLVVRERMDLIEANRLFALLNMSIFDAYVSSFNNKFFYNHWRPYTAIRWAADDGNPDTAPEVSWNNTHLHTYAFPSYPSAHGMACAAAAQAWIDVLGDEYPFVMSAPMVDLAGPLSGKIEMHPPTRSFATFSDAALECAMSRVYLGIHFRYDSIEGFELGKKVGTNVTGKLLIKN